MRGLSSQPSGYPSIHHLPFPAEHEKWRFFNQGHYELGNDLIAITVFFDFVKIIIIVLSICLKRLHNDFILLVFIFLIVFDLSTYTKSFQTTLPRLRSPRVYHTENSDRVNPYSGRNTLARERATLERYTGSRRDRLPIFARCWTCSGRA